MSQYIRDSAVYEIHPSFMLRLCREYPYRLHKRGSNCGSLAEDCETGDLSEPTHRVRWERNK